MSTEHLDEGVCCSHAAKEMDLLVLAFQGLFDHKFFLFEVNLLDFVHLIFEPLALASE